MSNEVLVDVGHIEDLSQLTKTPILLLDRLCRGLDGLVRRHLNLDGFDILGLGVDCLVVCESLDGLLRFAQVAASYKYVVLAARRHPKVVNK